MIRLIRFLITGSWHTHKWEIEGNGYILSKEGQRRGILYNCRCHECGKMKIYNLCP